MKQKVKKTIYILLSAIVGCFLALLLYIFITLPSLDNYEYEPMQKTKVVSSDQTLIAEIYNEKRTVVSIEDMPKYLTDAIVCVEDKRFYSHSGVDPIGIVRAFFSNLFSGEIREGASTITQQVVRRLFLNDEQTYIRKIKEALLAIKFEHKYSKEEILEIYLNDIYLGEGTYGVQEASKRFFGKDVKDITLEEAALLAALPQAPSAYCPTNEEGYKLAKSRQEKILNLMLEQGLITEDEFANAINKEITILSSEATPFSGQVKEGYSAFVNKALTEVQKQLVKDYEKKGFSSEKAKQLAEQKITQGGLEVVTTLSYPIQEAGIAAIEGTLNRYTSDEATTCAYVSIDSKSGKVLAYYGGKTQIDMASSPRQPGSTIKPLYTAKAFDEGIINPNSLVLDGPITIGDYSPVNYNGKYLGYVPVREVIAHSLNTASVRIFDMLGVNDAITLVRQYGFGSIKEADYNYSFALGGLSYGFTPLEMAGAYSVFANDGEKYLPYFAQKVTDSDGKVIYEKESKNQGRVISQKANNEILDCLKATVEYGTGAGAKTSYQTYGKTGTTSNNKDFWFCGLTGDIATSIWVGRPDNQSLLGSSSWCASMYGNYINAIANNNALLNAQKREGIETMAITTVIPNAKETNGYYLSDQIASFTIPSSEYDNFSDIIVQGVYVDKSSDALFVEGKCQEENKELRYYKESNLPKRYCTKSHFFENVDDFFNKGNKKDKEKD